MSISMSEVFSKKFAVSESDITAPSEEENTNIMISLENSLALAQNSYEKKLKPPDDVIMNVAMTE